MKKGSKIFGALIKVLGRKSSKEAIRLQVIRALDTNGDGKLTLEDYAQGKWKDISWWRLAAALGLTAGLIWFGYNTLPEWIEFLITTI